eukprot:TRINITY_DN2143_c0_g1_i1.p1 TRINITY_DN2143_c0_g1~~TRINITY_DN2143_c0_g1_i1.p1  ORF type:complete len:116 (+),score=17.23 TRINITY_DN2143_c0_g1_i1:51-398(+)
MPGDRHVVFVGANSADNIELLIALTGNPIPDYLPTVFDNTTIHSQVGGKDVGLSLIDTTGEQGASLNKSLEVADVVVISFSLVDVASFEKALNFWGPQVKKSQRQSGHCACRHSF